MDTKEIIKSLEIINENADKLLSNSYKKEIRIKLNKAIKQHVEYITKEILTEKYVIIEKGIPYYPDDINKLNSAIHSLNSGDSLKIKSDGKIIKNVGKRKEKLPSLFTQDSGIDLPQGQLFKSSSFTAPAYNQKFKKDYRIREHDIKVKTISYEMEELQILFVNKVFPIKDVIINVLPVKIMEVSKDEYVYFYYSKILNEWYPRYIKDFGGKFIKYIAFDETKKIEQKERRKKNKKVKEELEENIDVFTELGLE